VVEDPAGGAMPPPMAAGRDRMLTVLYAICSCYFIRPDCLTNRNQMPGGCLRPHADRSGAP
jgi:hypothetical protein